MQRTSLLRVLRWIALSGVVLGLLMPLVFIKELIFPFVFSKLIFFQIVIGLTFPAYLLLAWMDPASRPKKHSLLIAVALYFVAMALATVFSVDPMRSWWGNQERMNGYFTLLHFFAWFLMATSLLKTWKEWEMVLRAQVIIGGLVAFTAIWQKWRDPFLFYYEASGRFGGVLDNPIYQGMYQMFTFFLLALLALKTRAKAWWALYGVLALLGIGGFAASQSRGPLVGLFAGIVVSALCFGFFSKVRRHHWIAGGSVATMFLAYGALYLARGTQLVQDLGLVRFVDLNATGATRLIAWKIAWKAFLDKPVFGWGFDTFHLIFSQNYNPISLRHSLYETWFDRAHNTIFDVLSMTGAFGLLTYLAIFVALFWSLYRAYKKEWIDLFTMALLTGLPVAYFVQNLFVFDHPAGFMASYLLFALVVAATREGFATGEIPPSHGKERAFSWFLATPLVLGALLLVWRASFLPAQASVLSIRASQLFPKTSALNDIERAMKIWTPYRDEQLFLVSRTLVGVGERLTQVPDWKLWLRVGTEAGRIETERHPKNAYAWYIYARLLADTAHAAPEQLPLAEQAFRKAIEMSPKRQQLFESLARLYLRQGRVDDALREIETMRQFDIDHGFGDWQKGIVLLFDAGKDREGAELIASALLRPFPFIPNTPRESVPVFHAYRILGKGAELDRWANKIVDDKSTGDGPFYQFAYQSRLMGRKDLEERFVAQAERLFPGAKARYEESVAELERQTIITPTLVPANKK